jgi:hypothetical protein
MFNFVLRLCYDMKLRNFSHFNGYTKNFLDNKLMDFIISMFIVSKKQNFGQVNFLWLSTPYTSVIFEPFLHRNVSRFDGSKDSSRGPLCSDVAGYQRLLEDGGSKVLRKVRILSQHYMPPPLVECSSYYLGSYINIQYALF